MRRCTLGQRIPTPPGWPRSRCRRRRLAIRTGPADDLSSSLPSLPHRLGRVELHPPAPAVRCGLAEVMNLDARRVGNQPPRQHCDMSLHISAAVVYAASHVPPPAGEIRLALGCGFSTCEFRTSYTRACAQPLAASPSRRSCGRRSPRSSVGRRWRTGSSDWKRASRNWSAVMP